MTKKEIIEKKKRDFNELRGTMQHMGTLLRKLLVDIKYGDKTSYKILNKIVEGWMDHLEYLLEIQEEAKKMHFQNK